MGTPIWLLATTFEPRGRSMYTLRLAARLPDEGFDPTIVCKDADDVPPRFAEILKIVEAPLLFHPLLRPWAIRRFLHDHAEKLPALIHAHRRSASGLAANLAARIGRPYFVTIHDPLTPRQPIALGPGRLERIFAVSPHVKLSIMRSLGIPEPLVSVVASGVELPEMPLLRAPTPKRQVPVVGTAAAFEPSKGLVHFLLAAEIILSSGHDVEFVIAGRGREEELLRRMAQHLEIANRMTFVTHATEYGEVLAAVDVFVITSLEQGLGTIALEAMALGKPVVATKVGGIADFFADGEHALLVPPGNSAVLAEKIQQLLDHPEKARKLATVGQQAVRARFSCEQMGRETAAIYRVALSGAGR